MLVSHFTVLDAVKSGAKVKADLGVAGKQRRRILQVALQLLLPMGNIRMRGLGLRR